MNGLWPSVQHYINQYFCDSTTQSHVSEWEKSPQKSPKPLLDNTPIKQVKVTKSLGVYIDENILWDSQIDHIYKKIASGIGALKRIKHCVPFSTILTLFKSLIQPHFDYCCIVWGNCNKGLSDKLQKLQNRAARVLLNATYDSNADQLFEVLGLAKFNKTTFIAFSYNGV